MGLLVLRAVQDNLGANPVEVLTHSSGEWALRFLLITLMVTPLRTISGWSWLLRYRRMLGLFAFFYAVMHFVIYIWIDQSFLWEEILADIIKRPYITVGFAALLMLVPLAITSTKKMIRRLGKRWSTLHQLAYVAAIGGAIHFLWLTRADYREPAIYLVVYLIVMAMRLPYLRKHISHA
jgi:sulfoxide reductase heme-binding subunit YedZ